jgi:hypothetical protein
VIGLLGRWNGSLAGSCVPCLRSSSVGSRSPSVGLRCSALGLLESFLGLLGCSATCWLLYPSLCLLGSPILIGWENDLPRKISLPLDRKTHIFPWEYMVLNKQAGPTLFISTAIMVR